MWISDTKSVQTGNTVSFKHKYLTTPTITPADALLAAADDLRNAIGGNIPQSQLDKGFMEKFMAILNADAKNQHDNTLQ